MKKGIRATSKGPFLGLQKEENLLSYKLENLISRYGLIRLADAKSVKRSRNKSSFRSRQHHRP